MNRYISDKVQKYFYSFISGAIAPLAFSPYDVFPVVILSTVIIIYLWLHTSPRTALLYGYFYGLGFFGFGVSWIHISINLFGGVNIIGALILTFILVAFLSIFPAMTGYGLRKLKLNSYPCISVLILAPVLWTLGEWVRSWIFTGFPWLNLGYSQTDSVLNGFAPLLGVFGISFLIVFTSAIVVSLFSANKKQKLYLSIIIIFTWSCGWLTEKVNWTTPTEENLSVALIQGAIPQKIKWRPDMRQPTMDLYINLTQPYARNDLIIWPEAAIPIYYNQAQSYIEKLLETTRTNQNNLLTGMPVYDKNTDKFYNSVVFLGNDISFYYKKHLVPFGEYLPLKFLFNKFIVFFNIPMADFSTGPDVSPILDAGRYKIGISICYEDVFGNEVIQALPEAGVLVNISNDAWFGDSAAPHQHLQMARMRAMETGRYLLRATNTGITAIIDEKGIIISRLPQFIPGSLTGNITIFNGSTFYSRFGNYPVILFCLFILSIIFYKREKI
ncbi:MAG: apolipoprotein N-acyltransferase [Gammaproteobacteria bacterium]|jgi:apolipoprotein N-acyltransferase